MQFLSSFIIFNLIKFVFLFTADVKEEFKTQAGIDAWRPWSYGQYRLPFIPYGQKKGGNGSGGLASQGNGGERVTQGGGEENEDKEGW